MKRAYKQAMDQIAVSDHMRTRVLASVARPRSRMGWVKPVCGAAACFALICTVGLAGLEYFGPNIGFDLTAGSAEKAAAPEAAGGSSNYATADCALEEVKKGESTMNYSALTGGTASASEEATAEAAEDSFDGTEPPADQPQTLIANPVAKYPSLEKALDVLTFDPIVPEEALDGEVTVIGGEVLQICWDEGVISYTYRTAEGDADVSGIYTDYDFTETVELDSCDMIVEAELKGNGQTVSLALWQRDGMTFSLWAEPGVSEEKITGIIG